MGFAECTVAMALGAFMDMTRRSISGADCEKSC